ncbi:hypothetical protein BH10PLA2_BH10PLA2_04670 [soil metagenome]
MRRVVGVIASLMTVVCVLIPSGLVQAADGKAKVYVVLWFDTEDYLLPASDDAALRLATFLKSQGVKATFKVVGEKARTLEKRGRTDVINALRDHEIGYHSNFHSTQPSPALYLNQLGWTDGVIEFDRREKAGFEDVRRIFGQVPSCYGQPGTSWAPQAFGAMRGWGMPIYLDAGQHVKLDDKPYYYGGIFTMYKLAHQLRTMLAKPADVDVAEQQFQMSREALLKEGGSLVSIIYHPCEFVHKEFWDGVNFREGANPPRSAWKLPREKTAEEKAVAFGNFERYITFMKHFPEVQFITAREALHLYRDESAGKSFSRDDLKTIAQNCRPDVSFVKLGNAYLSAAEAFTLLNSFVARSNEVDGIEFMRLEAPPFGPGRASTEFKTEQKIPTNQVMRTAVDVQGYVARHGMIPNAVWLGSVNVPPEVYLQGLATLTLSLLEGKEVPAEITFKPATLAAAKYVSDDDVKLWKWAIFPKGFHAPSLMQTAKLQAWTLKPAVLHPQ